jgi:3-hydroxyacyl-[acyl-carrier-protein] dehydratase
MATIDIEQIKELIPHRYPFLFVDRVIHVDSGKEIIAIKNVTANEGIFNGHFPQQAVMPGFLTLEALAQAAGILHSISTNTKPDIKNNWYFLAGVNKARFSRLVIPGDQVKLHVKVIKHKLNLWFFDATASVGDEVACKAELMIVKRDDQ